MILVIGGKTYPAVSMDELSVRHTLELQRELVTSGISSAKSWGDVQALLEEFSSLPPDEQARHPECLFLTAVSIWACRVMAGERVSLLDAVDVPFSSVQWVPEPTDRQETAAGKAQPRAAAGAAKRKGTSAPKKSAGASPR